MNLLAQIKFDDAGKPILAAEVDFAAHVDGDFAEAGNSRAAAALQALQHGLLIVIADGPAAGARVRAGALARLCDLFSTDAEAAAAVHVHRSTMMRSVRRMKNKIIRSAQRQKNQKN